MMQGYFQRGAETPDRAGIHWFHPEVENENK
jgi:hypothetical protein